MRYCSTMLTKLKNRWNDQEPYKEGVPKIFSKEWFQWLLVFIGAIILFIVFVLITGDKFEEIFGLLTFGGFCFFMGLNWGLHIAKIDAARSRDKKKR